MITKFPRAVLRQCGKHWYATAWIVFAVYVLIRGLFRGSDDSLFMMVAAPIGACAFMVAFFSPVFLKTDAIEGAQRKIQPSTLDKARLPANEIPDDDVAA